MSTNCTIFSWNVRGLNDPVKRESVKQTIISSGATIVCLQETKISIWSNNLLQETLGCRLAAQTMHLPSQGASGGILIACDPDFFDMSTIAYASTFSITVRIKSRSEDQEWDLTGVYGPQNENEKLAFLSELRNIQSLMRPEWAILGDFNMIRRKNEKNKGPINSRLMRLFNNSIDSLQLMELDLHGRLFTWSNEQNDPTMSRIDRFLATTEWHDLYPTADLQAFCTLTSDHCPLIMQGYSSYDFYKGFRFESF
jgi:exonuclease III